jgi:hypothetical protein
MCRLTRRVSDSLIFVVELYSVEWARVGFGRSPWARLLQLNQRYKPFPGHLRLARGTLYARIREANRQNACK